MSQKKDKTFFLFISDLNLTLGSGPSTISIYLSFRTAANRATLEVMENGLEVIGGQGHNMEVENGAPFEVIIKVAGNGEIKLLFKIF